MRIALVIALALLGNGCASAPASSSSTQSDDPTQTAAYQQSVAQLTALVREAEKLFANGKADEASALIEQGQPAMKRALAVPRPTLPATEAVSDLDQLYGRMLLGNRHYGWARLQFQKNLFRWKHWEPQTPETAERLRQAEASIAECDRHITE